MLAASRFYALDGIRGLAALAVAAYHYGTINGISFPGFLAVDLFFVLSGFVIALSYGTQLDRGLGTTGFIVLRMQRLYPLWVISCAVALATFLIDGLASSAPKWLAGITVTNLLMLPAPAESSVFPLNMPGWSLFFEMLVNIAFAAVLWKLRKVTLAAIMVIAGALLAAMASAPHYVDMGSDWPTFTGGFPRTLYSFLFGVLIFRLGAASARRTTWLSLLPISCAILVLLWNPPERFAGTAQLVTVLALFPALVWLAVRWEVPRVLHRAAHHLGNLSYPIYVLHVPLLFLADPAKALGGSTAAGLAIYVLAVVLLAVPAATADRAIRDWMKRQRRPFALVA